MIAAFVALAVTCVALLIALLASSRMCRDVERRKELMRTRLDDVLSGKARRYACEGCVLGDVVERMRDEAERERVAAVTDELTGLHNRRYFTEQLVSAMANAKRHGEPLSCVMFDIDHFKSVNDTWGHAHGDVVLQVVARLARASVRAGDIVARVGGEEFVVLLPRCAYHDAVRRADELRSIVAASDVGVTISLGVAVWEGESPDRWLASIDRALYRAKDAGRNMFAVSSGTVPTMPGR